MKIMIEIILTFSSFICAAVSTILALRIRKNLKNYEKKINERRRKLGL